MNTVLDQFDRGSCKGRAPRFVERLLKALSASDCHTRTLLVTEPTLGTAWEIGLTEDEEEAHVSGDYRMGSTETALASPVYLFSIE